MTAALPAGYERIVLGRREAVVRVGYSEDARVMLAGGSLYHAAARDPAARPLAGRGVAWAVSLPVSQTPVVVRHNRHGGLFAPITRDLFLAPTRAPHELAMSLRLAAAGVRTPPIVMYGIEPAAPLLRRADVVTRMVEDARDLATYMMPGEPPSSRADAWRATHALVAALGDASARHHDLNVKNVLLSREHGSLVAWVLDVDRVEFTTAADARAGNAARLLRSARKWRDRWGAEFVEGRDL